MNNIEKQKAEFIEKCKNSDKFFYEEYIIKQPANKNLQSYTPERFNNYIVMAQKKHETFKSDNNFLKGNNFRSYPLVPEQCFYKNGDSIQYHLNGTPKN